MKWIQSIKRLFTIFLNRQVKWVKDNLDGYLNFYSVSGDGRVTNWTIVKTALWFTDTLNIEFTKSLHNFSEEDAKTILKGTYTSQFFAIITISFHHRWWQMCGIQSKWWYHVFSWNRWRIDLQMHHWIQF